MTEKLLPIRTDKYDESSELDGLENEAHFYVSPHHVPRELLARYDDAIGRITAQFHYLTDQEESEKHALQDDLLVKFGSNSGRMISVEFKVTTQWNDVACVLANTRKAVNHYVAFTVLRDFWSDLLSLPDAIGQAGSDILSGTSSHEDMGP